MLTHLHIQDLVIVRSVELDFQGGMSVLTGETGAGKSILIDALGLALGDRAEPNLVRDGAERSEISASFDISASPDVARWLVEQSLDSDDECMLRRVISCQGRSKGYINGHPVAMQSLQDLGNLLVDIHGQHAHQSLLHTEQQRQLLDDYAGHPDLLEATADLYHRWNRARHALQELEAAATERATRLDLLRYQVEELDELKLQRGEFSQLQEEHRRLANIERLRAACREAVLRLYDTDEASAHGLLGRCIDALDPLRDIDKHLEAAIELLNSALIQVQEASSDLRSYAEDLELNPQELEELERRLGLIQDLARKHRIDPDELPDRHQTLRQELDILTHADIELERLQAEVTTLAGAYQEAAEHLRRSRTRAALELQEKVTAQIRELGMPDGQFAVTSEHTGTGRFGPLGTERVLFLVSANPGQPVQALSKVASGGELSRISLAIQVVTTRSGRIPTLIFDEVDVGIGGRVAEIVGRLLRTLGGSRQVFCVTHLPQVAAQGHQHLQVRKLTEGGATQIRIQALAAENRIAEVARMLGGIEITRHTLTHAREMLEQR